ncbi:MAG: hypothetical protein FWD74_00005, partial [Actinomycetia bacterium]|nr:hypothetical protein [Actinomycetes bacterium]
NADGSFASTINPAILPTGTYKIAIDDLSSQGTAALGGGNRNYLTFDGGYLKLAADGAYTITTSFSSGTSFNIDAAGTDLGTIKLAPFVTPTSNPAGITIASGSTNFCPNYSVKPTIPKFASGVTVKVTAYSTTSSKFSSTGTVANQKAVWSTSYAATGATKTVSYTPPSSLAGKYLVFGVTGSKTNATSWTVLYSPPLKIYNNVCKVSTGWVKAWSKKSGGTLKAGRKVAISATTFKQSGMKATYKWLVNGKAVKNGTGRTLALKSTWGGKTLKVQISVTRAGNKTITKTITLGKIAY